MTNRGNVTESFERGGAVVSVERDGAGSLGSSPRRGRSDPGHAASFGFVLGRRLTGRVLARVDLASDAGRIQRVYRLRL